MPDAEQYYKLSQFKERIHNEHTLYYETFESELDCAEKLRLHLSKMIDLLSSANGPGGDDQYKKTSIAHSAELLKENDSNGDKSASSSPREGDVLDAIRNSLGPSKADNLLEGLNELNIFEKTHLKLLLQIAMSDVHGEELLNNHHINLLYKNRADLLPTGTEKLHLFRTLLHSHYNRAPGWYWIKGAEKNFVITQITRLALQDPSTDVRKGAIDLLKLSDSFPSDKVLKIFSKNRETFILDILRDDSKEVIASAIDYLKTFGDAKDIKTIQNIPASDQLHGLIASILSKEQGDEALAYILVSNVNVDDKTLSSLKGKVSDKDNLLAATSDQNINLAKFALEELISRFDIPVDVFVKMLKDSKSEIKELCLRELIKKNKLGDVFTADLIRKILGDGGGRLGGLFQFGPNTESVVQQLYESFPDEKLLKEINWMGNDADIAYEVYTKRQPKFIPQVRQDLQNDFDRLKLQWERDIIAKYGDKAADELNYNNKEKVEEYIRNKFRAAALSALAEIGDQTDITIARDLIKKDDNVVKEAALKIIEKHGIEADSKLALEIVKSSYGNLNVVAERTYFSLAPRDVETVLAAIKAHPSMAEKSLEFALKNNINLTEKFLNDLLLSYSEMVRESAISYLVKTCTEKQLGDLLNVYLSQDSYYYDVVCWLDRVLYAVEPFKTIWKQKLEWRIKS